MGLDPAPVGLMTDKHCLILAFLMANCRLSAEILWILETCGNHASLYGSTL